MASGVTTIPESVCSFEPSLWKDFFIHYKPEPLSRSEEWIKDRTHKLKGDIHMLFENYSNMIDRMNLVDVIQRLGIEHLFEEQIATALSDIHESEFNSLSLQEISLCFRLLREHGIWVSPAYVLIHGELELEEAISFARHHLELLAPSLTSPFAEQVKRALHVPLPRTYRRLEALRYMPEYQQEAGHNPIILELAKLEFNLLQAVHLKELKAISEWYNDLSGYVELTFARDRVVECYLWGYSLFYEEEYALARMIFAKLTFLHTLLDDTNDVGASLEEYRMLDTAIQRWDKSAIYHVPGYLKKFYNKLLICFKEFDDELRLNGRYSIDHIKKEVKKISISIKLMV